MISPGLNLVMTIIGFAVSTMFIVFVCTRLICARIQLHASTRSFVRSDLSIMERGIHGLEPVVVSSFPTEFVEQFTYRQDKQSCSVCLSEYQEKDLLRVLPYCGHAFHGNCIDTWLKHHWTCPICRISLRDSPDRKRKMQPAPSASMPPLARENFVPDSSYCQSSADEGSEFVPDTVRVNAVSGRPKVLVAAGLPPTFESREKQTENPSDS